MNNLVYCLQLMRSKGINNILIRDLLKQFRNPKMAIKAALEISERVGKKISLYSPDQAQEEINQGQSHGITFITQFDQAYPKILANMESSPLVLACKGNLNLIQNLCIGIVGSRNASLAGRQFTFQIAQDLSQEGISIISGLASGIDTEAHKGSLKRGTVAVIAGGIGNIYPKSNEELYHKIEEQGLILSERPYNSKPQSRLFPMRNRIIAGLCRGVVIVEAGERSGSLITANIANNEGREVLAVPNFPLDPRSRGTNKLIKEGATLVEDYRDVLDALKWHAPQIQPDFQDTCAKEPVTEFITHTTDVSREVKDRIFDLTGKTPVTIDSLVSATNLTVQEAYVAIIELALEGKVERQRGQKVARVFDYG